MNKILINSFENKEETGLIERHVIQLAQHRDLIAAKYGQEFAISMHRCLSAHNNVNREIAHTRDYAIHRSAIDTYYRKQVLLIQGLRVNRYAIAIGRLYAVGGNSRTRIRDQHNGVGKNKPKLLNMN